MSKPRKLIIGSAIIVVVAMGGAAHVILSRLNQPESGIITLKASPVQTGYTIKLTPQKQIGKYISFSYPGGLKPKISGPVIAPDLETFNFSAPDITSWFLSIDVQVPRGGTLSANSGFSYRHANPATYQESQIMINNQTVIVMTDMSARFSKVAYILHGPLLATVSLYGDDAHGTEPLQTTFMMVLKTLQWRTV